MEELYKHMPENEESFPNAENSHNEFNYINEKIKRLYNIDEFSEKCFSKSYKIDFV